ncbi:MAG: MarR family transcriptional regulator [Anaerovoracaceae bacterium]
MKENKPISSGHSLFVNFSLIHRHAVILLMNNLKKQNIDKVIPPILILVKNNPGTNQEFISKALGMDKSAITKAIHKQVTAGYIRREQNPNDKRAYNLYLTETGQDIIPKLKPMEKAIGSKFTEGFTTEEIKQLNYLLDKVANNLKKDNLKKGVK